MKKTLITLCSVAPLAASMATVLIHSGFLLIWRGPGLLCITYGGVRTCSSVAQMEVCTIVAK